MLDKRGNDVERAGINPVFRICFFCEKYLSGNKSNPEPPKPSPKTRIHAQKLRPTQSPHRPPRPAFPGILALQSVVLNSQTQPKNPENCKNGETEKRLPRVRVPIARARVGLMRWATSSRVPAPCPAPPSPNLGGGGRGSRIDPMGAKKPSPKMAAGRRGIFLGDFFGGGWGTLTLAASRSGIG